MPKIKIEVNNHEHAGKACKPGQLIDVDEETASWLVSRKIGSRAEPVAAGSDMIDQPKGKPVTK